MTVIGKTSKENVVIMIVASLIFFLAAIILLVLGFVLNKELQLAMFIISTICFILSVLYLTLLIIDKKRPDEAIEYDEKRNIFLINKKREISLTKIKEINFNYRGMPNWIFKLVSIPSDNEYGNIIFILNDNLKIKSLYVNNVEQVFRKIKEIKKSSE